MYYWKGKTRNNKTLEEELMSLESVTSVKIATAYISDAGVNMVKKMIGKYNLPKDKVTLYLSKQFSTYNPGDLLESIYEFCQTRIFLSDDFHSKVYLVQGNEAKLMYGSSNLTNGGFGGNIEFNYIGNPTREEQKHITEFFDFCQRKSTAVDNQIITYYKEIQGDLGELNKKQRKINALLSGYEKRNDAFAPDDYDINDYFFSYSDYETFFERNAKNRNFEIERKRNSIRSKMLTIHESVYPKIRQLNLYCHKNNDYITSTITLNSYNNYTVAWIGIRYGKSPAEVYIGNTDAGRDDNYRFYKHGSLQICIFELGFDILLHLAVKDEAYDRLKLSENSYQLLKERRSRIEKELAKLTGEGFVWHIYNDNGISERFCIDQQPIDTFCDWFMLNDSEGRESHLRKSYKPDDVILKDVDSISKEVVRVITKLEPLYNAMVWRPSII